MRKTFKLLTASIVLIFASSLLGCGGKYETVIISGSTSVQDIMTSLAANYLKTRLGVRIEIGGSGSAQGYSDAVSGTADIGLSSSGFDLDYAQTLNVKTLCLDGIALIVNSECSVESVSKAEISALYRYGTPIQSRIVAAVGRDGGSGTRSAFDELVGLKGVAYKDGTPQQSGTGAVKEAIISDKRGISIAYISVGALEKSLKTVKFEGVECSAENILNGSYRLAREFILLTNKSKPLSPAAQAFYDYLFTKEAQDIISKSYVSVN